MHPCSRGVTHTQHAYKTIGKGNLRMGMSHRTAAKTKFNQINQGYNCTPVVAEHARLMHVHLLTSCAHLRTSELSGALPFLHIKEKQIASILPE